MKIRKHFIIVGILAIFAITLIALAGCDNPTGSTHTHQWGAWRQTQAPTCTTEGEETRICTLDPTHIEKQALPIDPNAHNWGNWEETTAPTCTTVGEESVICTYNNSHTTTRSITALGHNYGAWTLVTAPSCTTEGEEAGTCTRDAATTTRPIKALGHNYGAWRQTTAPTCTTSGTETGTCTRDAATTTRYVTALGHNYGPWTQTTAPTDTVNGVGTRTCTRDAAHVETRTAYATGTLGLVFELINSTEYRVRAGPVTTGVVNIPTYHLNNTTDVYLPVTEIGSTGWQDTAIISITVAVDNPNYASEDGILYNKEITTLIQAPGGISGDVPLPATVITIDGDAFYGCTSLTSITIPESVISIGTSAFQSWISSQTIFIEGYASQAVADAAWGEDWRAYCIAVIKYLQSDGTYL